MDNLDNLQTAPVEAHKEVETAAQNNQKPRRTRRVGTFTMGFALIITGLALCATLFMPVSDVLLVAKLSPLLLVAVGIEIIFAAARNDGSKIKYDFLSFFMCAFLILGSIGASLLPTMYKYFGPERNVAQSSIENDITKQLLDKQSSESDIFRVTSNVNLTGLRTFTGKETIADLQGGDWVSIYIEFSGEYNTPKEFASAVLNVFNDARKITPGYIQLSARSLASNNEPYYEISLGNGAYSKLTTEQLEKSVVQYTFLEDIGYVSEGDINNYHNAITEYQNKITDLENELQNLRQQSVIENPDNNTENSDLQAENNSLSVPPNSTTPTFDANSIAPASAP